MHFPILLFLLLQLLFSFTVASFAPANLLGDFRLIFGLPICPDIITFTQPGLSHPSTTLLFDTRPLTGGTLNLFPNPRTGGSGFVRHFSVHPQIVGEYYGGRLSSRIQWDTSALGRDAYFVFFTPEVTFRTTWEDVIGLNQPLESVSGVPVYWFQKGVDYIVINNRCLLARDGAGVSFSSGGGNAGGDAAVGLEDDRSCFPSDAVVRTITGEKKMDQLVIGDHVWTGKQFSEVFAFTHRDPSVGGRRYVTIVLSNGRSITVTTGHYVYVDGTIIPAERVSEGGIMDTVDGDAEVVKVLMGVKKMGLYNPQTKDGDIVVDGVRVTTYTTAISPFLAHALLTPVRMVYGSWRFAYEFANSVL